MQSSDSIHGFRLSPQQSRLWRLQQRLGVEPFAATGALRITGDLDAGALRAAVRAVVERHEILRTSFAVPEGMSLPLQVVHPPGNGAYALRTELVPEASGGHRLVLTLPALVADLPSLGLLAGEIARAYGDLVQGRSPGNGAGDEALQYADVAEWLNQLAESDESRDARDWWLEHRSAGEGARLPFERPADPGAFAPCRLDVPLGGETLRALAALLRESGAGWHEALAVCWRALLHRLAGREELVLGIGSDGRDHEELSGLPGLLARYLPLRGRVDGSESFLESLSAHRRALAEARRRQDSLGDVGTDLPFLFEHHELPAGLAAAGAHFTLAETYACVERFTASLCAASSGEALALELRFDSARLDGEAAAILAEQFLVLLNGALAEPAVPLGRLECVGPRERALLLGSFGGSAPAGFEPQCVHRLFERQVERAPDRVALRFQGTEVTYRELNDRANRLARDLMALGAGPDRLVALFLDRSVEMVVALLAVLKAGGAYLPVETSYPAERIAFMLQDSEAGVLLTQGWLASSLPAHGAQVILLDEWTVAEPVGPAPNPETSVDPSHLAYQIYTSGSTGRPKGCQIEHRSLFNYVRWLTERLLTDPEVGDFGLFTPLGFDFTVTALYGALLRGKSLYIYPQREEIGAILAHTFDPVTPVDAVKLTPSHATLLPSLGISATNVRLVLTGGERLAEHHVRILRDLSPDLALVNHYGPTETTVGCVSAPVPPAPSPVAIGRPLPGVRIHVVDAALRLAPVAVAGEICVAGNALARGYHGRPDLTAERFVPDPFGAGGRLYRTGDLGRWLADGTLEYLGRIDDQVKIRGFRVELGEIEARLRELDGVADCAVVAREDRSGDPLLVAYVVPDEAGAAAAGAWRDRLAAVLPDWMVPARFVPVPGLPRTPNGKLDRKGLRELAAAPAAVEKAAETPRDPVEEILAGIWSGLLGTPVGPRDDFFHAGGHSLLATQAVYRIREALGVDLSLEDFFARPTIEGLAPVLRAARAAGLEPPERLEPSPRDGDTPLSFAQQRLWFLWRLEGPSPTYNLPLALRLRGSLDTRILAGCLGRLVERHEVLRTVFESTEGEPRQVIRPPAPLALEVEDLESLDEPDRRARVEAAMAGEAARAFDLERGPLFVARLLREGPESHVLLLTLHHVVADGWSLAVVLEELKAGYGAGVVAALPVLPELPIQYADFAVWQRAWLSGPLLERQLAWWRSLLEGAPALLDLPTDRPRPVRQSYRGATLRFRLEKDLTALVRALSRENGSTLYMVLLAGFATLLARWSGQDDLVVGSPIANRNRREIERLVGFFVNTLALRARLPREGSFLTLLRQVRETTLGAYAHQDLPFERLVEELQPERTLSHAPLFQAMLVHQNVPMGRVELPGLRLETIERDGGATKFDLHLALEEREGALTAVLDYGADLFDAATIERLAGHFRNLLAAATAAPAEPVWTLDLLSPDERHQVVTAWNDTDRAVPGHRCIHHLFESQVVLRPDAEAVRCRGRALTYAGLDRRADGVAAALGRRGIGRGRFVALFLDRSVEMAVGGLGALKSGAAYVALDPAHPPERLREVLEATGAAAVLTRRELLDRLPGRQVEPIFLDDPGLEEESAEPRDVHPDDLAYGVSTSGSTGRPKIILCRHRGVVSHLSFLRERHGVGPGDTVLQLAPLSFDSSVRDLLGPLAAGARVEIAAEPADPRAVADDLEASGATAVMSIVPSFLEELAAAVLRRGSCIGRLRLLLVSGEALHPATCRSVWAAFGPGVRLVNQYGPTEGTLTSTFHPVRPEELESRGVPVGRPADNVRVYVLRHGTPAPIGVHGEVFLGGAGLAEGYLGQPELTAQAFVESPLPEIPGQRLYRTGDLARWLPDGNLQFLGRADRQVKIRGVRVELAEVEAALRSIEGVREAAVAAREDGPGTGPRLVAWVAGEEGDLPAPAELRERLRARLPETLVPSVVVPLAALPRTANGKVDLQRLPAPAERTAASAAPLSQAEELMAGLWAAVLGIEGAGPEDDFFALGGHSLLVTRLVARIEEAFGVGLPVRAVFETPGLRALTDHVLAQAAGGPISREPIPRAPRDGELPLSFSQRRLWFLGRLEGPSAAYNVPLVLRLSGDLNVAALAGSLARVVERHESLRTVFREVDGRPLQAILDPAPPSLPAVDLAGLPPESRDGALAAVARDEADHVFDLGTGPLFRLRLLRRAAEEHVLLATLHHTVTDAWSTGIFLDELARGYAALIRREEPALPPLPVQYADFAVWQRSRLTGATLAAQESYWLEKLAGAPKRLQLPTDRPRPAAQSFRGAVYAFTLPGLPAPLRSLGRKRGATLFMALVSGFAALLSRYSGQDDLVMGSPVANRTRGEVETLIGLFANTLPLRVDLAGLPSFEDVLTGVRETTLGALAHQDLPFEALVEALRPERDLSHSPVFQVLFALQNLSPGKVEMPGLTLEPLPRRSRTARFDLSLFVEERAEELSARFEYSADLFNETTIVRMADHLGMLLGGAAARPGMAVHLLPLLTAAERDEVLAGLRHTARPYPAEPVHRRIAAQAARTPGRVAVRCGGRSLTYAELDARAAGLASRLRQLGIGPGDRVGLLVERSVEMVAALLGILETGAAYLPLDPAFPRARLAFMLRDAEVSLALTGPGLRDLVREAGVPDLLLPRALAPAVRQGAFAAGPEDLAYVLYTSGSTGRPKGVQVPHGALSNFLHAMEGVFALRARDVFLSVTTLSFDIAGLEIFLPLLAGARLEIAEAATARDGAALAGLIRGSRATALQATPSTWRLLLAAGWEPQPSLRMLCGGEALPLDLARELRAGGARLWNLYGPTETTIWSTLHEVTAADLDRPTVSGYASIGRPIDNTAIYLLDPWLGPVPAGVPGELWIGGDGVARGYQGRPGLTAERFLPDPCSGVPGGRLYRTGDLARWLPGGRLEFLGRADDQVKVRGFRVEPGEVEAALAALPAVRQAVVTARPGAGGDTRLVAYVVPAGGPGDLDPAEVRRTLRSTLPDSMIPAFVVPLAALPLTANGKVDRRALPDPEPAAGLAEVPFVAPRTPDEERMAALWRDLLETAGVGVEHGFFELGGHSLLAARLVSRIRSAFGVELPVRTVFEHPTVAGLCRQLWRQGPAAAADPVRPLPRNGPSPLSFAQRRLWFLAQFEGPGPSYNVPAALRLEGPFEPAALEVALGFVIRRHESLRTVFTAVDGEPVQVVLPAAPARVRRLDLTRLAPADRERETGRIVAEEIRQPFDLAAGPLLRCLVVRRGGEDHVLILTLHHIVSDAWSLGVLLDEVAGAYRALRAGARPDLPPLAVQYADFAAWQNRRFEAGALAPQLQFWIRLLADAPRRVELPADRSRPARKGSRGAVRFFALEPGLAAGLDALGRARGATPFMVLLAGFLALLARIGGQEDLVAGSPVANRNREEVEPLIGLFANTLALRVRLDGAPSFGEAVERVREVALAAQAHPELPFEKLVEELQPERDPGRTPLFNVVFAFQNAAGRRVELPEVRVTPLRQGTGTSKFDLLLVLEPEDGHLRGRFEYDADLFDAATIERLTGHFQVLLRGAAAAPETPVPDLPLLTADELHLLLVEANDTWTAYPREGVVHGLFEEQVDRAPAAVAVEEEGGAALTYAGLDLRANRVARGLARLGVHPGDCVALYLERSADLVAALLGVLKAGAAYVPLDPSYPSERLDFLVRDAGIRAVISRAGMAERLPDHGLPLLLLDSGLEDLPGERPGLPVAPGDLAYVLYTSGSTGRPKGVGIPHRAVVRLVRETSYIRFTPRDVVAQAANASFDAATLELWGALLNGARLLIVATDTVLSPRDFGARLADGAITVLWMTAGLFNQYSREVPAAFGRLEWLLIGGEALDPAWVRRVLRTAPPRRLLNGYGPTECTTFSTTHLIREVPEGVTAVPIGRPISNARVHVLDRRLQPQPLGVAGELYVGGDGLAVGYLGRPDLTAERFVPDPFAEEPGERLYRTGDLVRRLADGTLVFLGRADEQVKLRGFRIELGEIEAALSAFPEVAQAAVALREDEPGEKRLVAYLVLREGADFAPEALRRRLAGTLPEPMIPAAFVPLESLPLTPNGKLDRRALPRPGAVVSGAEGRVPPRTAMEKRVAGLWSDLLGVEELGVDDDFFVLGGHSLLVTRLASRLREALAVDVPIYVLFERTTLAELSAWLEEAVQAAAPADDDPLVPMAGGAEAPLSFAQQRLWFLEALQGPGPTYNVPSGLRLTGELQAAALEGALRSIVARHEILRTVFRESAEGPVQVISPAGPFPLPMVDLQGLHGEARERESRRLAAEEARAPFDLAAGPLLRTRLLRLAAGEHTLLATMHHIVTDGWSMEVFQGELARGYLAARQGRESGLPPLPVQYADFTLWQRRRLRGRFLEGQLAFWRQTLAGAPKRLQLPTDRPRPGVQSFRGAVERFSLDGGLAGRLRALGQAREATLFMTLLCAFGVLLARHGGQDDVLVGAPIANRDRRELEPLIGFFANTLVLRVDLTDSPAFLEALDRVREMALGAFAHQDLPFEKLVEELQPERDLGHSPLFQAMLSLLSAARPPELPGLSAAPEEGGSRSAKFDLSLLLEEQPDGGLAGRLEYATDLFDAATVRRLAGVFRALLAGIVEAPETPVSRLPLLDPEARRQVLEGNRTAAGYLRGCCVHEDFEAWAGRAPERPAALLGAEVMTYGDLDRRANRLAHTLRRLGVRPGVLVGLYLPRSLEMLEALLAILKAGGAYLPLDPANPKERLTLVLADAGPALVLTRSDLLPGLPAAGRRVHLDQIRDLLRNEPDSRPVPLAGPEDLAYVIYTSGSTGRPKGVEISHGALRNYVDWANRFYFRGEDWGDFGLLTSLSFDFTVTVVFCPLTRGRKLVVYSSEDAAAALSLALRAGSGVNTLKLTPSHVTLLESLDAGPTDVRLVILGGEACTPRHVETLRALRPDLEIVNEYGPTEATVGCIVDRLEPGSPTVLIGRPIANLRAYILDEGGGLVPAGVVGELHLAGDGLARGYRGNPGLTAERFLDADLGEGLRERLYRTGDLARARADGRLELLGRRDSQVKIRGYRIELEEIEAALSGHPRVGAAVVAAWEARPGEWELAAYVVPAGPSAQGVDPADLAGYLRERLPEPMVPSRFLRLDALPLAASGKADRRRLPPPENLPAMASVRPHVPPRTPGERSLARLWSEVLGAERVGAGDDFFALGGHSLLAVRLMSRIHRELGRHLPLAEIFRHPTLERMAAALDTEESGQSWDVLVPIRSGEGAPVALVPGAGGNPLYFLPLARRLGNGHPVYGLQAVGLDGWAPPLETLEEVAARWVEALLRACPAGPWTLVGHSFGGRAAYEMARQLLGQGVEVSRVVVLDAAAPDSRYAPPSDGWDDARWIEEILGLIGKLGPVKLPEPGEVASLAPEARLDRLRCGLEESGLLPAGGSLLPVRGLISVFRANHRIRYAPCTNGGPRPRVVLVRAEQVDPRALEEAGLGSLAADPALGWSAYSAGPVEVHTVPGDHMGMLGEPSVKRLAALLSGWLAEPG